MVQQVRASPKSSIHRISAENKGVTATPSSFPSFVGSLVSSTMAGLAR